MKIIIAGSGEVGYHLAKQLSTESHDITVIDVNASRLERVQSNTEVLSLTGSSASIKVLNEAGVSNSNLVIAVTASEAININTAILAKKLGAKKTVARVSSGEFVTTENLEMFRSLGIDHLIYPEELAAFEVVKLIERAAATDVIDFENGKLTILGIRLDKQAPVLRKTMRQIASEYSIEGFRIAAIQRGMRTIIPSGEDIFLPNDQIFAITTNESMESIIKLAGKENTHLENVMIFGGGKIGGKAAKLLEEKVNIKLLETDNERSRSLAEYLDKTLVIQGDARDLDLLAQEGIVDMDAFIAVTDDAETNIISCLLAKHLGVAKTIALVDNVDYIPLTQTIGLDSLINKKLITANNITRFVRKTNIVSVATIQGVDAEVFEYIAQPNSPVTKNQIKDLKFPKNALIGGYIRDYAGYIAVGDTQIRPFDKVVVVALPGVIQKIEKYFNK